jgi:hypothetical protein
MAGLRQLASFLAINLPGDQSTGEIQRTPP